MSERRSRSRARRAAPVAVEAAFAGTRAAPPATGRTNAGRLPLGSGRGWWRPLVTALQLAVLGCAGDDVGAARLPRPPADQGAVIVVRSSDCDGNFALFRVFDRPELRRRVPLLGVVPLDADADTASLRRSLRAFDVAAPVVVVAPAVRAALRAAVHDEGMTLVVYDRDARTHATIGPPHSREEHIAWTRRVSALGIRDASARP